MKVLLAGNVVEAVHYAHQQGWPPRPCREWTYVADADDRQRVSGIELAPDDIVVIGSFWGKPDSNETYDFVKSRVRGSAPA